MLSQWTILCLGLILQRGWVYTSYHWSWIWPFPVFAPPSDNRVCSVWRCIPRIKSYLIKKPVPALTNKLLIVLALIRFIVDNWNRYFDLFWRITTQTKWSELLSNNDILSLEHMTKSLFVIWYLWLLVNSLSNSEVIILTLYCDVTLFDLFEAITVFRWLT